MALFGENNGQAMTQRSGSISDQINMVGEGTVLEGTLRAESDVRVSGRIAGELRVEGKAIVAQDGTVEGEISATDADVAGSVQGEIYVSGRLVLKSTARVDGNIQAARIVVEEGALFTGECRMGDQVRPRDQAPVRTPPARNEGKLVTMPDDRGEVKEKQKVKQK